MILAVLLTSLSSIAADFPPGVSVQKLAFCRLALTHRDSSLNLRPFANVSVLNEGTSPHPHELRAANDLGLILSERDQKLLVITTISDRSIPGFDGVVVDSKNLPVANVALKSVKATTKLKGVIDNAIHQVVHYTVPSNWADVTNIFYQEQVTPKNDAHSARVQNAFTWMTRAFGLFGIGSTRPTYIFANYEGNVLQALSPGDFELLQKRMNQKRFYRGDRAPIVSEVILQGLDGIYHIKLP